MKELAEGALRQTKYFFKRHWLGTVVILVATLVFFAPLLPRLNSYSEGGDAMFNAWAIARNHACILKDNCPNYTDANIYFPNKDTMLYSETQLSVGVLTLPLKLLSDNPVFYYNTWLIVGFFLNGWFMYLLAKRISRGNEPYAILAGLIFEFAPHKMLAIAHMQLVSIFLLPLAILLIINYLDSRLKRYAIGLFAALAVLFYSSWYLMVFALAALVVMVLGIIFTKIAKPRDLKLIILAILFAVVAALPLAKEYARFSRSNYANFTIGAQTYYAASVADYVIPHNNTIAGKVYDKLAPENARRIPYSADGNSYHGIVLYSLAAVISTILIFKRKNKTIKPHRPWLIVWALVGVTGIIMSLGPLLKIGGSYIYGTLDNGVSLAMPLPYLLLDFLMPQILFIRSVERWGVLVVLALCIMIAYLPLIIARHKRLAKRRKLIFGTIVSLIIFELMPSGLLPMSPHANAYAMKPPAIYQKIKADKDIDNIVILTPDKIGDGSGHGFEIYEWLLWSGYHNKNIFNGYSGYEPPSYKSDMEEFLTLSPESVDIMKAYKLRYVLIDKNYSLSDPGFEDRARQRFENVAYQDDRFVLYKLYE